MKRMDTSQMLETFQVLLLQTEINNDRKQRRQRNDNNKRQKKQRNKRKCIFAGIRRTTKIKM